MRGGYQLVNLKNVSLVIDSETTVPGVYATIEGNYNKRLVLTGVVIGGTEYDDTTVEAVVSGQSFVIKCYGYTLTIASDDGITVASALAENVPATSGTYPSKAEFNALLGALKDAGIMQPDEE